jgi:hypothetical protein
VLNSEYSEVPQPYNEELKFPRMDFQRIEMHFFNFLSANNGQRESVLCRAHDSLKGHSLENDFEIIPLNHRLCPKLRYAKPIF